jgi:hypothetical protein
MGTGFPKQVRGWLSDCRQLRQPFLNMTETKECSKCGEIKSTTSFYKDRYQRCGFRSECKTCFAKYDAAHYKATAEQHADYNRAYYQGHKEQHAAYMRQWYQNKKEKQLA